MPNSGRRRALDDAKRREICAFISAGSNLPHAAKYVGCSISTIKREMKRNPQFHEDFRRAEATAGLAPLKAIRHAAQTNWRAAAWMLERSDPEHFGHTQAKALGPQQLRRLARELMTIFEAEIDHPLKRDRILMRVQAAIEYATQQTCDTKRSGNNLRKAIEFFEKKNRDPFDWQFDAQFDHDHDLATRELCADIDSKNAKLPEFCTTPNSKTPSFSEPNTNPSVQND